MSDALFSNSRRRAGFIGSLAIGLLLVAGVAPLSAQTKLRWKLKEGQQLKVNFQQRIDTETRVNKVPIQMTLDMGMEMDWRVEQVDSQGLTKIAQSFSRMTMKMRAPKQPPLEFDSASERPAQNAKSIAASVAPLIGAEFFVSINELGEVVNVQLSEKAQQAIDSASKTSRVKDLFSKEGVAKMLKQSAGILPKQLVSNGDKWSSEQSFVSTLGDIAQTNEYVYRGEAERAGQTLSQIDVVSQMKVTPPAGGDPKAPRTRLQQQETKGVQWFDTEKGRLVESSTTQKLTSQRPFANTIIEVVTTSSLSLKISDK